MADKQGTVPVEGNGGGSKNGGSSGSAGATGSIIGGSDALSAANNNMPNNPNSNSNAKISNGPGMTERNLQGVEEASTEARTSQMASVSFIIL